MGGNIVIGLSEASGSAAISFRARDARWPTLIRVRFSYGIERELQPE